MFWLSATDCQFVQASTCFIIGRTTGTQNPAELKEGVAVGGVIYAMFSSLYCGVCT